MGLQSELCTLSNKNSADITLSNASDVLIRQFAVVIFNYIYSVSERQQCKVS